MPLTVVDIRKAEPAFQLMARAEQVGKIVLVTPTGRREQPND